MKAPGELDGFIGELWSGISRCDDFLILVDHGGSPVPARWRDHGKNIPESAYTWFAVLGPDTTALGERSNTQPVIQAQVAATLAAFVGEDFKAAIPEVASPVSGLGN